MLGIIIIFHFIYEETEAQRGKTGFPGDTQIHEGSRKQTSL